jgi:hypothetical protein
MSSGNKTLLVLAGIAAMVVTVAFSAFVILVQDEPPPPDDNDLLPRARPEVPPERNAWTYYAKAGEKLNLPQEGQDAAWPPAPVAPATAVAKPSEEAVKTEPDEPPPNVRDRWNAIVDNTAWEQPLVDEVLKRNAEALALWEKALAAPECLVPESKDFMQDNSWAFPPVDLGQLVTVRARNYARQGESEAAMDDAMRLVRYGQQVECGRGAVISYVVGITIKGEGLVLAVDLMREVRLPPDRLRRCAGELSRYEAGSRALEESLRAEYAYSRLVLDGVGSGVMDPYGVVGGRPTRTFIPRLIARLDAVLFKPNRTRRLMAEAFREMVAAAPKHYSEAPHGEKFNTVAWEEQRLVGGNVLGGQIYGMVTSGLAGVGAVKCQSSVQLAATRVLLAMKAFKLDKGRLPERLEELAPAYLDSVPIDDFDGKPLRYNPVKKIIYTVGKDLKDDGGMTKQEFLDATLKDRGIDPKTADPEDVKNIESEFPWQAADPSFPIDF